MGLFENMINLNKPSIVVLASGRGSNFEAICRAIKNNVLFAEIKCLISNKSGARVLEIAKDYNIPAISLVQNKDETQNAYDSRLLSNINEYKPNYMVLAGYMKIITPKIINSFMDERGFSKIVNIHPSLLPAFPGLHSYQKAFEYGVKYAGVTVHFVSEVVDAGTICAQESFFIENCKSAAEVEDKGLEIEHKLYSKTLNWILNNKFKIELVESTGGRRYRVLQI